ncbi:MAG: hypothetical protein JXQ65_07350 [Candidatus Marinimicrobia bacterium]|nr:hypothetical protein [Candidatus Neomarinimicrobiota bacterium]
MKILSSLQSNLSDNFFRDQRDRTVQNSHQDDADLLLNANAIVKQDKTQKILSSSEKNTMHIFFGTQIPDEMKLYGHNSIKQITKGQLLDVRG